MQASWRGGEAPVSGRAARRLALAGWLLAGCAGSGSRSAVIARSGSSGSGWTPRAIGLMFPQLAPDAMPDRDVEGAGRPLMGAEITAVVHAALRTRLEAVSRPPVRDLSAAGPSHERMGLLATTLLREYWLNG